MGGGLLQLAAYGVQDIYLTDQPQITFFKLVYKRHTNFALESILLVPNDVPALDTRIVVPVTRNGDLLKRLWMQVNVNLLYPQVNNNVLLTTIVTDFTHALIKQVEIEIGGQIIDRQYGKWLTIWRDLTELNPYGSVGYVNSNGSRDTNQSTSFYNRMAYTHSGLSISYPASSGPSTSLTLSGAVTEAYVPFPFWFCRNPGLALPLIALQYHNVNLNMNFASFQNIATSGFPQLNQNNVFNVANAVQFYGDYIYLDTKERKLFVDHTHEYLIEQLQLKTSNNKNTIKLNFINPVKYLVFTGSPNSPVPVADYKTNAQLTAQPVHYIIPDLALPEYTFYCHTQIKYLNSPWIYSMNGTGTPNPIIVSNNKYLYNFGDYNGELNDNISRSKVTLKLVINGKDQFTARNLKYFTRKTIWESCSGVGSGNWGNIALIPFCLNIEEHQPSGAVNFSIISDARLIFDNFDGNIAEQLNPTGIDIYAMSYNILKITGGMGGTVYGN
jgi:hypothetical protein